MEMTLSTPALLFPTISLLFIAYTNRFLAIAHLIRNLKDRYIAEHDEQILEQIINLRRRLNLIRNMQWLGVFALFLCMVCMVLIFMGFNTESKYVFGLSLILLTLSLFNSLREIQLSIHALNIDLQGIEADMKK